MRHLLTQNTHEHTEVVKYITSPYEAKLPSKVLYRWLKVLEMPSSRELIVIRKALRVMKSKGASEESMEMNLLLAQPECPQWLLALILKTCLA